MVGREKKLAWWASRTQMIAMGGRCWRWCARVHDISCACACTSHQYIFWRADDNKCPVVVLVRARILSWTKLAYTNTRVYVCTKYIRAVEARAPVKKTQKKKKNTRVRKLGPRENQATRDPCIHSVATKTQKRTQKRKKNDLHENSISWAGVMILFGI